MEIPTESLTLSYYEQLFKIHPAPQTFEDLISALPDAVPSAPTDPLFTYTDPNGSLIRVWSSSTLSVFYNDHCPTLTLNSSFQELVSNISTSKTLTTAEEDSVNLILLGLLTPSSDTLSSIKIIQTPFCLKLIQEILFLIKVYSMEKVADKLGLPWQVIFYITQAPGLKEKKPAKKISYAQVKNIFRPSKCLSLVQQYIKKNITKKQILEKFSINEEIFHLWLDLFADPPEIPVEPSHISDKDRMKLVSCYLLGELRLDELKAGFGISESQIWSWALNFSQEGKVYQREKKISAEEKYEILDKHLKGQYSTMQFQNDYGVRGDLLYAWKKQVQKGKKLQTTSIFRSASIELEQAYNIFLESYN